MILVTGGTGLLGGHLIAKLLQDNSAIVVSVRKTSTFINIKQILSYYYSNTEEYFNKIKWIEIDFDNPIDIEAILTENEITEIYHCAGMVSFDERKRKEIVQTNYLITENLVNACLGKNIKLCYASSVAALLNQFEYNNISEKTFWHPGKFEYAYAYSKYMGECSVWRGIEEGLNAVIVNPGIIIGAGNWETGWGSLVTKANNKMPFYTNGTMGYIAVEDVSDIMIALMNKNIFGKRFILVENNYSFKEILEELNVSLGKPLPTIEAKKWMLQCARLYENIKCTFNKNYNPSVTKSVAQSSITQNYYNNELIKQTLSYTFIPIKESIHKASEKFLLNLKKK